MKPPRADPYAWLEAELIRGTGYWQGVVDASTLLDMSSELCALLFGQANSTGWEPLFANRGVPVDASAAFFGHWSAHRSEFFGESWVSLDELEAIDWSRPIRVNDAPKLIVEPEAGERYWNGRAGFPPLDTIDTEVLRHLQRGERIAVEGGALVRRQLRFEDAKYGTRYPLLLDLMRTLKRHSEGAVRWVVAFSE
ncbi:MAG: hypothetical protein JNK05_14250 [Myxococcales bacterium]|nr:hypothetical protein [Myxococcales bacterium]